MRQIVYLLDDERRRPFIVEKVRQAPLNVEIVIRKPQRSEAQNRRMHSMLGAIVKAGTKFAGRTWGKDTWRDIMLLLYCREKKLETGTMVEVDGEFWILGGTRSSELSTEQFSEWMDMIDAWMAERGIAWDKSDD